MTNTGVGRAMFKIVLRNDGVNKICEIVKSPLCRQSHYVYISIPDIRCVAAERLLSRHDAAAVQCGCRQRARLWHLRQSAAQSAGEVRHETRTRPPTDVARLCVGIVGRTGPVVCGVPDGTDQNQAADLSVLWVDIMHLRDGPMMVYRNIFNLGHFVV